MAKADMKTRQNDADALDFIRSVEHERRREDGFALLEFFNRVTGWKPKMWGDSIIGYGRYEYKYQSGREGEYFITGFSPRKTAISIYIMPGYRDMTEKLSRLGKHKSGKSCLYINRITDIDQQVLEEIVMDGMDYMKKNYQCWPE
ncbi:MAG: DUF1801 domain-containing protein [Pseudomonadota bacterium]